MKLNPEIIEELESLYEAGLNNVSTQDNKKIVADLAARRHIDEDQIKVKLYYCYGWLNFSKYN